MERATDPGTDLPDLFRPAGGFLPLPLSFAIAARGAAADGTHPSRIVVRGEPGLIEYGQALAIPSVGSYLASPALRRGAGAGTGAAGRPDRGAGRDPHASAGTQRP